MLCSLFDMAAYLYAPRGCIRNLKGPYVDCYRHIHPYKQGFTCPAAAPAGRIDYIFASPALAGRLTDCDVLRISEGGMPGDQASDHLPITAEFGLRVASGTIDTVLNRVDHADNVMVD
jgi:exonuclease III